MCVGGCGGGACARACVCVNMLLNRVCVPIVVARCMTPDRTQKQGLLTWMLHH